MDNKFELIFNEREDAAELKNLPIGKNLITFLKSLMLLTLIFV